MAEHRPQMSLLFDVWLVMHATTSLIDEALTGTGLSGDDFGLYSLLRRFGPATPSQISRWSGMRPTTVSAGLKRLDNRGHGERTANPDDGRSSLIALTPAGVAAHTAAAPRFLTAMSRLADELRSDGRHERAALERLDAAFRAVLDLDPRPYDLSTDAADDATGEGHPLRYPGPPLSADEEAQVLQYIAFLRTQTT